MVAGRVHRRLHGGRPGMPNRRRARCSDERRARRDIGSVRLVAEDRS